MLVEREPSLKKLQEVVDRQGRGQGQIVLLAGEAGIGKTTLLHEFTRRLGSKYRLHWGGCEALFTPRPLGTLQDMASTLDPQVAQLLNESCPQDKLFPVVLNAIQNEKLPSLLVFEDVHWADNATLDLLKYLGRRIALLNAILIMSFRSDEVTADHPLSQVLGDLPSFVTTRIELQPLTKAGVATLASRTGHSSDELFSITEGNPFFVTELLARSDEVDSSLPHSIRDAVWARLARLTSQQREFLEICSIVPGAIQRWLARSICGDSADAIIDQCIAKGLLVRDQRDAVRFRHELARKATLERLSNGAQKLLHARIDAAMRQPEVQNIAIPLSVRVHHAAGADDAANVLHFAPRAAKQAAMLGAHREAASHLKTALRYVGQADNQLAAELYEDWSYEAGLTLGIDDEIISARQRAIELWQKLGRVDKVGLNLRWLSRLHWYRGESHLANSYIDDALKALEDSTASAELAMVISAKSQMHMLHDRTADAISWGKRAIAMATELGEAETRIHALNNVGSAMLFSGDEGGMPYMEESLQLALHHGFHEQAARAYTNYAEWSVLFKHFGLAERILSEGIAFDTFHDLDAWTYYLIGRQAQLRMEQGRFREAETIARGVLQIDRLTLVMKLPARTVLAKVCMRLGASDASAYLQQSLKEAMATGEAQNITPVRLAMIEEAYVRGDLDLCRSRIEQVVGEGTRGFDPWERGELAVWCKRTGLGDLFPCAVADMAAPRASEINGDCRFAADQWLKLGLPYEAALSLTHQTGQQAETSLHEAISMLDEIGAKPASLLARKRAEAQGIVIPLPKMRRGPYGIAKHHPLGLTSREVQILEMISKGLANADIAKTLNRSQRTIEHHVSSVLAKLNAQNRMDVVLRLRNEPWLMAVAN